MGSEVKRSARAKPRLRAEQARRTRRAVLDAARELFLREGYAGTTMRAVAARAGVSVETVYKVFGNKAKLVKAVFDVAVVGDDEPVPMLQRQLVRDIDAEPDPARKLERYGQHIAEVNLRVGRLLLVVRDAAVSNPDAARVWEQLQEERARGMAMFAAKLDAGGFLRPGVTAEEARDVLWAFNSVETWDLFVNQRGWAYERWGDWLGRQLTAALLS
ncbi:MAG TPA: helix-turn-helix domain-containing protein [Jatrophihabitantaceae bacterium]|nr:helix-turn-helix domain-containing protein [Jatrophihabitantaceae bacterium]